MFSQAFNVHYIQNVDAPLGLGNGLDIRGKGNIIDVEISKDVMTAAAALKEIYVNKEAPGIWY